MGFTTVVSYLSGSAISQRDSSKLQQYYVRNKFMYEFIILLISKYYYIIPAYIIANVEYFQFVTDSFRFFYCPIFLQNIIYITSR